jgi:hypothetical protein
MFSRKMTFLKKISDENHFTSKEVERSVLLGKVLACHHGQKANIKALRFISAIGHRCVSV